MTQTPPPHDSPEKAIIPPPNLGGFWALSWNNKRHLISYDLVIAIIGTALGLRFVACELSIPEMQTLLQIEGAAGAGLLGVIIAAMAIIAAFLHPDFIEILSKTDDGFEGEFWPYSWVAALCIGTILSAAVGYVALAIWPHSHRWVFGVSTFFFLYAIMAVFALFSYIINQASNRAYQIRLTQDH